ncbi:MAG TPA: zinc ribbon domain-containing protein [Candidatus Acidoferrales bacterium]|nr:zinc ribbon domain-containing protein [Candidatus Acidoferrales bacterium]
MYCEACGNQLGESHRFCPNCGKPQSIAVIQSAPYRNRVQQHVHLLAILWIAYGIIALLGAMTLFGVSHFIFGQLIRVDAMPFPIHNFIRGMLGLIGTVVLAKGVLGLCAGWGLLQRESWARAVAIVASFLALINIPLGTAIGVYSLWVLLPENSGKEYEALAQAA